MHEVTSPQAFDGLRLAGRAVRRPDLTLATEDHNVPTVDWDKPIADPVSRTQVETLRRNAEEFGVRLHPLGDVEQGIVHVVGPQLGLTQPGMTIVCGDSHTATHGAFGALAHGIGTSEVEHVLATQCLLAQKMKNMQVRVEGKLGLGVTAKDVVLAIIGKIGTAGGTGYAVEFGGEAIRGLSMEARMSICNMSIEGGARIGYVNPDETAYKFLRGRPYAPAGGDFDRATDWWGGLRSEVNADYDDVVSMDGAAIEPMVTWGINPGHVVGVGQPVPDPAQLDGPDAASAAEALEFMQLEAGQPIAGRAIDVAFIGSCTNGRLSDLREAAAVVEGRRVAAGVKALAVPGSQRVREQAEEMGLDEIFRAAGFEWREAGCSMCLAMNSDKLVGDQMSASTSNRNFKGRQGSPTGRTLLMSPAMVAAAAISGEVTDVRELV